MDGSAFFRALRNTFWWTGLTVIIQLFFGLILALLLDTPFRGRGIAQALVFLPWAVPTFLTGLNWAWLFNPIIGPLPHWLYALGILSASPGLAGAIESLQQGAFGRGLGNCRSAVAPRAQERDMVDPQVPLLPQAAMAAIAVFFQERLHVARVVDVGCSQGCGQQHQQ